MALSHETQTYQETPEVIAQAFETARKEVVAMTSDPVFHDACIAQKLDPYDDMDKPAYWDVFADYSYTAIGQVEATGKPTLQQEAAQILAETPRYLFAQSKLTADRDTKSISRDERRYSRSIASYYNQLLRTFAYNHPEARVSDVKNGLNAMSNIAMEDEAILQSANREIYATIHGAQHELAFGQILAHTGREFYPATTDEDLTGNDYIIAIGPDQWLGLDVKASDRLVTGNKLPFAVKGAGQITVHSLTHDNEFGDKFFTSEAKAASKAPYLDELIVKAAKAAA